MNILENNKSVNENFNLLHELLDPFLATLQNEKVKNSQKIMELCHVGKFLMFFNKTITIDKLFEKPDFVLCNNGNKIGLEHQIVIDSKAKEREGFFENIFSIAESDLQSDPDLPNFLANCYIKQNVNFKLQQKQRLISVIKSIVKEFVLNDTLIENPIIEDIWKMPHSRKNINANLGTWWTKNITPEIIEKAVIKKEKKIMDYRKNSVENQWLLLVIDSTGESSYEMDKSIQLNLKTEFDKIYLLEDHSNKLYEIK